MFMLRHRYFDLFTFVPSSTAESFTQIICPIPSQVCSMKGEMIFHNKNDDISVEDQLDAMRERVNEYLPADIRVLDIERVTR